MLNKSQSVLILGYGEMGHAMQFLLQDTEHLDIWNRHPAPGMQPVDLQEVVPRAALILFCLPVNAHHELATTILPYLNPETICASIAKGLNNSGQTAAQIFTDVFPAQQPLAFIYGPMISEEIQKNRYAYAQLALTHKSSFQVVQQLFTQTHLYLEYSDDLIGVSWSVILKNVYALLFGITDGLELGDNVRGYLAVACLRELQNIVVAMGGLATTSQQLAGLGDLITTATSSGSHHHALGKQLARGKTCELSGEGVHTFRMVQKHKLFSIADYPIFELVGRCLERPADIDKLLHAYMQGLFLEKQ